MLFNSIEFAIFLPIVFIIYWFFGNKNLSIQNYIILFFSYIFYGWWDWRFLILIFLSTLVDFYVGNKIFQYKNISKRKFLLLISILFNLSLLGIFKYFNFFIESFNIALNFLGHDNRHSTLNIILPVGISFYTFQTMSYTIDIYRRKIVPTNDFLSFAAFVSFFPQLVAGPIERASNLLPQILSKRKFNYIQSVQGLRLALWGLFKKVVIADSLSFYVNFVFANVNTSSGVDLFFGLVFFAFQIYCDFSGYSDIAIGISKLLGFELKSNFKFPYFSENISEFWRRWHISLSSWFRDYVYIPLGGSKEGRFKNFRNILIIFSVSGFWHGANWTFIMWGILHFIIYLLHNFLIYISKNFKIKIENIIYEKIIKIFKIILTFFLTSLAWVFFRSESVRDSFIYIKNILFNESYKFTISNGLIYIIIIILLDILWKDNEREPYNIENKIIRYVFYIVSILLIVNHFSSDQQFIYFQF